MYLCSSKNKKAGFRKRAENEKAKTETVSQSCFFLLVNTCLSATSPPKNALHGVYELSQHLEPLKAVGALPHGRCDFPTIIFCNCVKELKIKMTQEVSPQ